jgi:hypothetical protein
MSGSGKLNVTPRALGTIVLVLAVVAAGAGWFLVVAPKRSEASKLEASIQAKQAQVATETRAAAPATAVDAAQLHTLGKALPDEPLMPDVVDQLNHLANLAGVTLDTVTPSAPVPGTGYEAIPLSVVVDGHYFDVERFLNLVRTQVQLDNHKPSAAGRLFDVNGFQLQQTEPAPMVTATLDLRTFYYSSAAAPVITTATDTTETTTTSG